MVVESEVLALFADPETVRQAEALGASSQTESLTGLGIVITKLSSPDAETNRAVRSLLNDSAPAERVEENHIYRPMAQTDGMVAGWAPINQQTRCIVPRRVGMVDTGVSRISVQGHADFPFEEGATPLVDGHGDVVAALIKDLANVDVLAANAFSLDDEGRPRATALTLVKALDWLVRNRADLINMSLAGPPNRLLEQALERVYGFGTIVVAAAGNNGPLAEPAYPAAYETTLAVAAHDRQLQPFSGGNRGDYIDLSAPGVGLATLDLNRRSGTSLAAALVTGALAASPQTTAEGRLRQLRSTLRDLGEAGRDPVYGAGGLVSLMSCR